MTTEAFPAIRSSAAESFAYYGPREGWLITLSVHRDSDALDRSNWKVISEDMVARFEEDVAIERMNHWAVGWVDYLLVRPGSQALGAAKTWQDKLAQYPVADDDDFALLEDAEMWCVRCDGAVRADHPTPRCKRFRSADDADEIESRWRHRR